jgi:hypothetical protein
MQWLAGFGDEAAIQAEALRLAREHVTGWLVARTR